MAKRSAKRERGRPRIEEVTPAQRRTFEAIREYVEEHEEAPTLAELCDALGMTKTPVHDSINQLIDKGYLERRKGVARGLRILREPENRRPSREFTTIPLLGAVSAGVPTFAEEDRLGEALVQGDLDDPDNCFALKVRGDSMLGAGMCDGDTVIVRKSHLAHDGDVVVALVEGEATIKRLSWKGSRVELQPENDAYEPIPIRPDTDFRIVGTVIGAGGRAGGGR